MPTNNIPTLLRCRGPLLLLIALGIRFPGVDGKQNEARPGGNGEGRPRRTEEKRKKLQRCEYKNRTIEERETAGRLADVARLTHVAHRLSTCRLTLFGVHEAFFCPSSNQVTGSSRRWIGDLGHLQSQESFYRISSR